MKIPQNIIDQIKYQADIVDVIGEYVHLKKAGNRHVGLCPFHEDKKTPSFSVSGDIGVYHCFGCKKSGNVFSFLKDYLGLSFNESVEYLAKRYNIIIPSVEEKSESSSRTDLAFKALKISAEFFNKLLYTKEADIAIKYFKKRDFSDNLIAQFLLGYSPDSYDKLNKYLSQYQIDEQSMIDSGLLVVREDGKKYDRFRGRAMFAIKDIIGRVIGFGARQITDEPDQPKYINSPQSLVYDKSKVLYGLYEAKNAIRNEKSAILVEGYADTLTLHQSDIRNVVATSGTAFTQDQLNLLGRYTKSLFLVFDSDSAGKKATDRGIELALENGFEVKIARLPAGEDPDSLVRNNGPEPFRYHIANAVNFIDYMANEIKKEGAMDNPSSKADAVRSIVSLISKIPDMLQHDFYLSRIADIFDLSENQLKLIYNEKQELVNKAKKNNDSNKIQQDLKQLSEVQNERIINDEFVIDLEEILPEEKLVLQYALQGPKIFNYILNDLNLKESNFLSETGKLIYSIILEYSDSLNITQELTDDETINAKILSSITELAISILKPSENWEKFGSELKDPDYKKVLKDAKTRLELIYIDNELAEIRNMMKIADNDHQDRLLIRQSELIRKKDSLLSQLVN